MGQSLSSMLLSHTSPHGEQELSVFMSFKIMAPGLQEGDMHKYVHKQALVQGIES